VQAIEKACTQQACDRRSPALDKDPPDASGIKSIENITPIKAILPDPEDHMLHAGRSLAARSGQQHGRRGPVGKDLSV
jgi:hypothetical protein